MKATGKLILSILFSIGIGFIYADEPHSTPNTNSLYEALLDSAEVAFNKQDWEKAGNLYREALRQKPASPLNSKIFANLGLCLSGEGKFQDAIEAFNIALIKEPDNARILTRRASAYLMTDKPSDALEDINSALQADSLNSEALRIHGQIMLGSHNLQSAKEDFTRLMKVAPTDPWGPAGLGEIATANADYNQAIDYFKTALKLEENSDFRLSLISSLLATNRLSEAESILRESILLYKNVGEFYILRGKLHKVLHQNREMEADKKSAIEYGIDPQIVEQYLPSFGK